MNSTESVLWTSSCSSKGFSSRPSTFKPNSSPVPSGSEPNSAGRIKLNRTVSAMTKDMAEAIRIFFEEGGEFISIYATVGLHYFGNELIN